jgi:hypothetical protein
MLIAFIADIELHGLIYTSVDLVALLVLAMEQEHQPERQDDN